MVDGAIDNVHRGWGGQFLNVTTVHLKTKSGAVRSESCREQAPDLVFEVGLCVASVVTDQR